MLFTNQEVPSKLARQCVFTAFAFMGLVFAAPVSGQPWSPIAPLNTNYLTDTGADSEPDAATDGRGNWVTVWDSTTSFPGAISSDRDILFARSTDNGQTWTAPQPLNTNAIADTGSDIRPRVRTDGQGTWITIWDSDTSLVPGPSGDRDVLFAKSTDNGVTWSAPQPVNSDFAGDFGNDRYAELATDRRGDWIVVWESSTTFTVGQNGDYDIHFSRSTDNGQTWSAAAAINSNALTDDTTDFDPDITTDERGDWVVVWESMTTFTGNTFFPSDQFDILVSRSANNGVTWSATEQLSPYFQTDNGSDWVPNAATDNKGNWVCVWESYTTFTPSLTGDADVFFSRSSDNAASWSIPEPLNQNALTDITTDLEPRIATDTFGNWVTVWESNTTFTDSLALPDFDIVCARSTNLGAAWTAPAPLNSNYNTDTADDFAPSLATDKRGKWIAVWESGTTFPGSVSDDRDILTAQLNIPVDADLAVTKTAYPESVLTKQELLFTIQVGNNGPNPATGVVLTDTLPASVTYVSAATTTGTVSNTSGTVTAQLGTIAPGTTVTVTITVLPLIAGSLANTATVSANEPDFSPVNNTAQSNTTVRAGTEADLTGDWRTLSRRCPARSGGRCKLKGKVVVINQGIQKSARSIVQFYLSSDDKLDPTVDRLLTSRNVGKIKSNRAKSVAFSFRLDAGETGQGMRVLALVDAGDAMNEPNEANNVVVSDPLP